MKIFVVIPAYNEEAKIAEVLSSFEKTEYKIVVVDDCSADKTAEIASQFEINLLRHHVNLGQGAALRTGTDYAISKGADIIVHFDADNQHRVEDVETIIKPIISGEADVVLGSRFLGLKSNLPFRKRIILFLAKIFSHSLLKLEFSDPQNGLRAFRCEVRARINWQSNDFAHCSEILGLIIKNRLHYLEVPIRVNYETYSMSKPVRPKLRMGWRLLLKQILEI
ncbi:glycosyltransferase family 2 protein [Candidatus Falkowbacteria bacterium]|nr:glycosyltransferase family 2 protein [Candidatus Falkowbacteria bacterium]